MHQVILVLIPTKQILLKGESITNKILSLATTVNGTKLLLASPLLFLVLTIATTPAQAQYWNGWYYQSPTSNDTIQDTLDIAMDKTTTPTIAQGILDWYCSGYGKGYTDGQAQYQETQTNQQNQQQQSNNLRRLVDSSSNPTMVIKEVTIVIK